MIENCYILYSCDGSYEPFISNFSGLSAYSESFVSVNIIDLGITPDTCFYVLSLGEIECDITYNIDVNTGTTCSCECYCYFIRSTTQEVDVTYVDCENNIIVETLQEGLTYNICSKVYPQFDGEVQIPIKITDICENNQCPATIPTVKPPNECDVITIFPMDVNCIVQNPSNDRSFDGAATLSITGGTPPYTIFWEIGSFAPTLTNLGVGEYSATVTDFYNDFTANTTCVLTAETLTISGMCFVITGITGENPVYISSESLGLKNGKPHYQIEYLGNVYGYIFWNTDTSSWYFCQTLDCQNISPYNTYTGTTFYPSGTTGDWVIGSDTEYQIVESYVGLCAIPAPDREDTSLCVTLTVKTGNSDFPIDTINIQLDPSNEINGEPSWSSSTGQYVIYWNTGSTPSQWTMTGYSNPNLTITNNDPSYPPLSNWVINGEPEISNMVVVAGECLGNYTISVSAQPNDAYCDGVGSITVSAIGGIAPYEYSIDGGLTYQPLPIFNNLTPGIYSVLVKDSLNVIGTLNPVVVGNIPPTLYSVTLSVNYVNGLFSITAPTLPIGVTISLSLVMTSTFSFYPTTLTPQPVYNNITTISGIGPMTLTNTTLNIIPLTGRCTADGSIGVSQTTNTYTNIITLTSNQVVTGSTTNLILNSPIRRCENAIGSYNLMMMSPTINNCDCCSVILLNPRLNPVPPIT